MIFYKLTTNTPLYSFNDPIGKVPIVNQTLSEHQEQIINSLGGEIISIHSESEISNQVPYFVFDENLFFTQPFLKKCLDLIKTKKENIQFAVNKNTFNERYILPTNLDNEHQIIFNLKYHYEPGPWTIEMIRQKIFFASVDLPEQIIEGKKFHMHQSDTFAGHIISPFHLLQINIAFNLYRTVKLQKLIPEFLRSRFGRLNSPLFFRGLKRLNKIGNNCNIHPTALIEGSIIGDNVTIGAFAIIRLSVISAKVTVAEHVTVINSVLGEETYIANSNFIGNCVTYPNVFLIHGPYQASIFGKNSACFAVINCDYRLDQKNIQIPTSQGILDSHQKILGIAYGHKSKTGGGNIIAAGRIVPNDFEITPPNHIILNFKKS